MAFTGKGKTYMIKMLVHVPVSVGELLDKLTILELKKSLVQDADKKANINHEYELLSTIRNSLELPEHIDQLENKLKACNKKIWDIENAKRACEAVDVFDDHFIHLSRELYIANDNRAEIKKSINILANSEIVEEKMYTKYAEESSI